MKFRANDDAVITAEEEDAILIVFCKPLVSSNVASEVGTSPSGINDGYIHGQSPQSIGLEKNYLENLS